MNISVVLPTYKERENIGPLIQKILQVFQNYSHKVQILVVDDQSPDGTAEVVKKLSAKDRNIHLLIGKKEGLGAAYIRGFKVVLKNFKPDVVVQMDADFSHNPNVIPRFISEIEKGADFVIGSRYVKGGRVPSDWNPLRKANSKWGNRFARYLAGIDDVRDCTSGFRAISRQVLEKIDLGKLKVRGYSFQMNLLYRAYVDGAGIKEVPINFKERVWGHTKIGPRDVLEFMWNSVKLRFEKGWEGFDKKALRLAAKKAMSADNKVVSRNGQTVSDEQPGFPIG